MSCTYSDEESWKKVKILKDRPVHIPLEQLYHTLLVQAPAKVRNHEKMARDNIPSPQHNFCLELPGKM